MSEAVKRGISASRYGAPALDLRNQAQDERVRKWRAGAERRTAEKVQRLHEVRKRIVLVALVTVAGLGLLIGLSFLLFSNYTKHEIFADTLGCQQCSRWKLND